MNYIARRSGWLTVLLIAIGWSTIFCVRAAADACSNLSSLALPAVTSISAASVPPNTFSPPPPFPGLPPGPPVPVAFCRVQLTVESLQFSPPQLHIEVWLPLSQNWNHRFGQFAFGPPTAAFHDPEHDVVLALQRWVEQGIAPDHLIAITDPQPFHAAENPVNPATFTRRLCPYPADAKYKGTGDPNSAASFICVGP